MWLGSSQQLDKIAIREVSLLSTRVTVVDTARDLGVVLDRQLSLDAHVTAVCRSGYYQLRQLRPITLSVEAAKSLVQAFIPSRLDYCNAILYSLPDRLMRRLQSVQNAAARLITGASRRDDHITPILRQLHWLPVRRRVDFKIAVLVFQCTVHRVTWRRTISSSPMSAFVDFDLQTQRPSVTRRTSNIFGDRCFAAAGPRLWNGMVWYTRV